MSIKIVSITIVTFVDQRPKGAETLPYYLRPYRTSEAAHAVHPGAVQNDYHCLFHQPGWEVVSIRLHLILGGKTSIRSFFCKPEFESSMHTSNRHVHYLTLIHGTPAEILVWSLDQEIQVCSTLSSVFPRLSY